MAFAGRPTEDLQRLADLLDVDEFKRAIQWLLVNRHGWSAGDAIPDSIREIANGIARHGRHWMVVDALAERPNDPEAALRRIDDHMTKLQAVVKKLGKRKFGMTEKNQELLRKFEDPVKELAILELPDTLSDGNALRELSPARAALRMQTAIAVEILLFGAPRMKNLIGLRIDRHLKFADPRSKLPTHIVLSASETKNNVPQELPLSKGLAGRIASYLERHWPMLADKECPYLFPGQNRMNAKTDVALRGMIAQVLRDHVGVNMTPHQFRHLAAWLWLKDHPGEFAQVQHFLHHRNIETTIRTYAGFDRAAAVTRHGELLLGKRGISPLPRDMRRKS
jgi:integrase